MTGKFEPKVFKPNRYRKVFPEAMIKNPRDKSKTNCLNPKDRIMSKNVIPSGSKTCNSQLMSRDGYCQSKGIEPFKRCKVHGGKLSKEAISVFSKALNLKSALKLEVLLGDTLSMDNELAAAKVMLVSCLENWQRGEIIEREYLSNTPVPPIGGTKEDSEDFAEAVKLHKVILKTAKEYVDVNFKRSQVLIKTLTEGVAKNSRIKEGNKFTLDVKQIRDILKIQIDVMAEYCSGCATLKHVVRAMRDKVNDIPIFNNMSKENKKAIGRKKYGEMLEEVQEIVGDVDVEDAEVEILD